MQRDIERKRERTLTVALSLDTVFAACYLAVGIWAGSITILAETTRGTLMLAVGFTSLVTLRRIHRNRLHGYDFGSGKLEQGLTMVIGLMLIGSAGFIFWRLTQLGPIESRGFWQAFLSILSVFINLAINGTQLLALYRTSKGGDSVIMTAQYRSRWAKTLASAVVVFTVSYGMLTADPINALRAEQIGSLLVIVIMIMTGAAMVKGTIPDLIDRSLPEAMQLAINRVLAANVDDYDQLGRVRSRRSGNTLHVELELFLDPEKPLGEAAEIGRRMERSLQAELPGTDPVIILRSSTELSPDKTARDKT